MLQVEFSDMVYPRLDAQDKNLSSIFKADLSAIRRKFMNNCVGISELVYEVAMSEGIISGVLTFMGPSVLDTIRVYDESMDKVKVYTHHSVTISGDCVIDPLHSNFIEYLGDYIEKLEELNKTIKIKPDLSHIFCVESEYEISPTLDYIKSVYIPYYLE